MDPELDCLLRSGRVASCDDGRNALAPLAEEDCEALRRWVRFVWTSATLVGVMGRALRAAAAAAALRDELLALWDVPWKAERAAWAADGLAVEALSG